MAYNKKIYDAVHGFIRFNDTESELIDSFPFQRLHYIRQLGIAFLVYPGATHTRFEHSLGTMELATRIFEGIIAKATFERDDRDDEYWKQVLRLAALCHDLGHLPFSHVAESTLLGKEGHEKWTLNIILNDELKPIWEKLQKQFPKRSVKDDIIKLSIGEKKLKELGKSYSFTPWERVLCQIITADFFGSDRIDYLLRDAQSTGLSYGLFDYHQLIEMLCILPSLDDQDALELGIDENGFESCEALLLARHFMHRRLYQYSTVKAYAFHLARFMKVIYGDKEMLNNLHEYLLLSDNDVLSLMVRALRDRNHKGHNDAVSLLTRQHRFKALEIPDEIHEKDLVKLKKDLNIPDNAIAWEFSTKRPEKVGLSFPVRKRNGQIVDASSYPEVLIPSKPISWVFVAPEFDAKVYQALEKS